MLDQDESLTASQACASERDPNIQRLALSFQQPTPIAWECVLLPPSPYLLHVQSRNPYWSRSEILVDDIPCAELRSVDQVIPSFLAVLRRPTGHRSWCMGLGATVPLQSSYIPFSVGRSASAAGCISVGDSLWNYSTVQDRTSFLKLMYMENEHMWTRIGIVVGIEGAPG